MDNRASPPSPWPGIVVLLCGLVGVGIQVVWRVDTGATAEGWLFLVVMGVLAVSGLGMLLSARRQRRRSDREPGTPAAGSGRGEPV